MRKQYSLRAVALAGVCLAPLAAAAQTFDVGADTPAGDSAKQYNNEIDIGGRYQSSSSPLYGRYTGTDSKGFSSLGGFHVEGGDAPDSGKTLRYQVTGTNLNFGPNHEGPNNALAPEAGVNASIGQQGTWKLNANYDAITYTGQPFYTPFPASGAVAPGITPANSSSIPALRSNLAQETAGTRRDIGSVDGKYIIDDWTVTSSFRHEHKEGTVLQSMSAAASGTAFPEPVDYDTDRYSVQGQYATRRFQAILGYDYNKFTDNNLVFSAPVYTSAANLANPTQYGLPGNSDAHYVTGMAAYNLTPTTRINGNFRYGFEMADDSLTQPYATMTNSAAVNAVNNGLAGLMARTYDGNVAVTSRPFAGFDVRAFYGIDGRDSGDGTRSFYGSGHPATTSTSLYNIVEQSWTKQKAGVEAGYKVLPDTKLTVGYTYEDVHRDLGDGTFGTTSGVGYWVGHSGQNTVSARLNNNSIQNLNTSLSYEHTVRSGEFSYLAAPSAGAGMDSGAFYQAPMTGDKVKLRASYTPGEQWDFGLNGKYETHAYHYPVNVTGTSRDYNANVGPDLSYSPTKNVAAHLFYNFEEIYFNNQGNGVPATTNNSGWSAATTNSVHTVGLSGDWKVTDRLKLNADYTFSYGDIGYNMFDGIIAPGQSYSQSNVSLPSIASSMHSVKLNGEYKLADNMSLLAGYGFDMYKDNDWQYGWNPVVASATGTIAGLSSGEPQNSYRVHSLYTAVRLKF